MRPLVHDLVRLVRRNKDGSYATQDNRLDNLTLFGEQLSTPTKEGGLGYETMRARDLTLRHTNRLVRRWKTQQKPDGTRAVSDATIRNRLAFLRWWAEKVDRPWAVPASNAVFGLEPRSEVARTSKATTAPEDKLARIEDAYVRMSVELQDAFGLRREEAQKIRVHLADQGDHLALKGSWCKGGKNRWIPITTREQREVLDRAKRLVRHKHDALILEGKQYVEQLNTYTTQTQNAELTKLHGLRHGYAHRRYEVLSGMKPPVLGGKARKAMTPEERQRDTQARLQLAQELGHGRARVVKNYCG